MIEDVLAREHEIDSLTHAFAVRTLLACDPGKLLAKHLTSPTAEQFQLSLLPP